MLSATARAQMTIKTCFSNFCLLFVRDPGRFVKIPLRPKKFCYTST